VTDVNDRFDAEFADLVTERLVGLGCTEAEVGQARDRGYLPILAILPSSIGGEPRYRMAEAATGARVPPAWVHRFWRALGFPDPDDDDVIFTDADVEALAVIAGFVQLGRTSFDQALQMTRVLASSMARIADSHLSAVVSAPRPPVTDELAAFTCAAGLNAHARLLEHVWRRHLHAAALSVLAAGGPESGTPRAIGFGDLVGFTALSQQLDDAELGEVVNRFETVAFEEVTQRRGRVVKMIGDEVMFVNDDAGAAVDTALALAAAYSADDVLSEVRVGLAYGPMLAREGDFFGPCVNFASRAVNIALPATVLVSEQLRDCLVGDSRFRFRALQPRHLKDIGTVRPWVAQRADDGGHRAGVTGSRRTAPAPARSRR
jgi:adenylate cyclase